MVKIAQIAPLMESVPPQLYGGTERVVSHLCEALVQEGHDVTLFASGDSVTSARLVRLIPLTQVPLYVVSEAGRASLMPRTGRTASPTLSTPSCTACWRA